jgi:hypothetical protein
VSQTEIKKPFVEKALEFIQSKGYNNIKAIVDEYDEPKGFKKVSTETTVTPDITATLRGRKHYFDVALKSEAKQRLISRWKFMSRLAGMKNGKFHLFAPHGHKSFAQRLVEKYRINAKVISI